MKHAGSLLTAIAIYLAVQGLGLWISSAGPGGEAGIIGRVDTGEMPPVVPGETEDSSSILQIIVYILISTTILLVLLKYKFDLVIRIFISLGLLGGLYITFTSLIGETGAIPATALLLASLWKKENILVMNATLIFAIPGIGSWIGASPALGSVNTLILILALAVYDIVAVFGTRHMVTLAEGAKGKIPLMFAIPVGNRVLGLGTGDLAIPLVFTVAVLRDYTITQALITSIGGLIGLLALFFYILNKKDMVLPALPPITAGLVMGYVVAVMV
ncbi:MAG: hypothetical protein JW724_05065 [Candidatus Altiarchaeota archaeon]|nr:hypothetical protein [Candidatus Altiarchaeota archaeon]